MNLKWLREWKLDTDTVIVSDGLNVQMGETSAICRLADDWGGEAPYKIFTEFYPSKVLMFSQQCNWEFQFSGMLTLCYVGVSSCFEGLCSLQSWRSNKTLRFMAILLCETLEPEDAASYPRWPESSSCINFWVIALCSYLRIWQNCGRICCLHLP